MNVENDKEFEDLFKRAAESFPLKTNGADWNAVLSKLEETGNKKAFYGIKKNWLIFFLLIAVGLLSALITGLVMNYQYQKDKENNSVKNIKNVKAIKASEQKLTDDVYNKVVDSLKKGNMITKLTMPIPIEKPITTSNKPSKNRQVKQSAAETYTLSKMVQSPPGIVPAKTITEMPKTAIEKNDTAKKLTAAENTTIAKTNLMIAKNDSTIEIKTDIQLNNVATNSAPVIKHQPLKSKFFYTGLLYAIDKSSIGFEPSKGSGSSLAFLLGYRFNKKFSLETGIHLEKKEYYTTGEHFDKTIFQTTGRILWIESENELIEIPISLKVDFLNSQKHELFGTVGFSSHLVNKQSFEYEEEVNGQIQSEFLVFTKNTSNFFSTANVSVGYQLKIKKLGKLRIEPYLNLPVSGIGNGKEPILSKGIYFGWIYEFHNTKLKQ